MADDPEQLAWEHESGGNDPDAVERFRDWGFGLFVHWGLSTQIGAASSWPSEGADPAFVDRYEDLVDAFDPEAFDPANWAELARLAGMRYVVITAKHHDGFCLFESVYSDFDLTATPYEGDLCSETAAAAREEGLGVGWYYSPQDLYYQRATGKPDSIRTPDYGAAWTDWDDDFGPLEASFLEYEVGHVEELMGRYGADVLFFDGPCEPLKQRAREIDPEVVVTRGEMETPELTTFEGPVDTPAEGAWEACGTVQRRAWSHKPTYPGNEFHAFKSANELLDRLIEIRAKGGNYLLDVGPRADGSFPEAAVDRLRNLAYWMAVNGDAIHGVRPWAVRREDGPAGDVWYTSNRTSDTVYAIFRLGWSMDTDRDGEKHVDPVDVSLNGVRATDDSTVRLLGQPDDADWDADDEGVHPTIEHRGQPLFEWYWPRYDWPVVVEITSASPPE